MQLLPNSCRFDVEFPNQGPLWDEGPKQACLHQAQVHSPQMEDARHDLLIDVSAGYQTTLCS